jgi:hypothetical protein
MKSHTGGGGRAPMLALGRARALEFFFLLLQSGRNNSTVVVLRTVVSVRYGAAQPIIHAHAVSFLCLHLHSGVSGHLGRSKGDPSDMIDPLFRPSTHMQMEKEVRKVCSPHPNLYR